MTIFLITYQYNEKNALSILVKKVAVCEKNKNEKFPTRNMDKSIIIAPKHNLRSGQAAICSEEKHLVRLISETALQYPSIKRSHPALRT